MVLVSRTRIYSGLVSYEPTAQTGGYAARIVSSGDFYNKAAYEAQSVLLLLGPTLLMFTVNLTQPPFMQALGATDKGIFPFRWQRVTYTAINTILFVVQAVGGGMTVSATGVQEGKVASDLVIASYIVQMVFWGYTFVENITFSIRLGRRPTHASKELIPRWKRWNQLFGLAVSIIAVGRNLMRLTEDGMGPEGFLTVNEWPSYAFDGYQMVVVMGAWGIFYLPGKCEQVNNTHDELIELLPAPDESNMYNGRNEPQK